MTNAFSLFRALIVYSICIPLAIVVGYLLATPLDLGSFITVSILLCLLTVPLFLKWHYPWMLLAWNMNAIMFFLPGKPGLNLVMIFISLLVSVLQYILNRQMKFISVPMIAKPVLFILLVVLVTARFTGGIGLNAFGGDGGNVGGKRYLSLIWAAMAYFALTAVRIPPHKRKLCIWLFYGGGLTYAISNLAYVITPSASFIFLFIPTDEAGIDAITGNTMAAQSSIIRLGGLSSASLAIISLLLALWGVRGFLQSGKYWRLPLLLLLMAATFFGGFRSQVITLALMLGLLFYLEGLTRTAWLPTVVLGLTMAAALAIPYAQSLPLSVQRSIAFLPVNISREAADNAAGSSEWRLQMWAEVLPEIPQYLILGKGLGISLHDLDMERSKLNAGEGQFAGAALAGDYHNGPLSLIIPFGIFGVAGFIWFLVAGTKVLHRNYKFGDPGLLTINRFFLMQFIVKMIVYFFVFGSFYADLLNFVGIVGFSIALNHGVAKPAPAADPHPVFNRFKLAGAAR